MNTYKVTIWFSGQYETYVDADDEESAEVEASQNFYYDIHMSPEILDVQVSDMEIVYDSNILV